MAKKFESFVKIVICALMVYALGVLSISSLVSTTFMEQISESEAIDSVVIRIQEASESVIYHHDDVLLNVILLAVFALICFFALPRMKKLSLKSELIFITVWTIVLGSIWVNSSMVKPTYDSEYVTEYGSGRGTAPAPGTQDGNPYPKRALLSSQLYANSSS